MKPGCRAVRIVERTASSRELGLFAIVRPHRTSQRGKHRFHLRQRRRIEFRFEIERRADRLFREVVYRRPETARRDQTVGTLERASNRRRNPLGVIADCVRSANVDAVLCQPLCDKCRVRIDELAEQQLGTDRNELNARHRRRRTIADTKSGRLLGNPVRPRSWRRAESSSSRSRDDPHACALCARPSAR